jgi:hypothetical protein
MSLFRSRKQQLVQRDVCPSCGMLLRDHAQSDIASARIGSEDEEWVRELVAQRLWEQAHAYQAANATSDIRVWRMIRCRDGRVGVATVVMPIEMWSDDYYEEPSFLTNGERDDLVSFIGRDSGNEPGLGRE